MWIMSRPRGSSGNTSRAPDSGSKADLIWKIAREPKAIWVGRFTRPNFNVKVRRIIDGAQEQGAVPILTVLRAQSTGCNPTYDGGGTAEDAARAPGMTTSPVRSATIGS